MMPVFNINRFHFKKSPCKKFIPLPGSNWTANIGKALIKTAMAAFISVEISLVSTITSMNKTINQDLRSLPVQPSKQAVLKAVGRL
jgi:hypothetical protein